MYLPHPALLAIVALLAGLSFRTYVDSMENDRLILVALVTVFWIGYFARDKL